MKLKNILFSTILAVAVIPMACKGINPETRFPDGKDKQPVSERGTFAKGADVSWLSQLESEGYTFKNSEGQEMECMQLLRDECGVNSIRLRVWVNPEDGWNSIDDVVAKAIRANSLGLRVMIDFHFSDTWADPSHQAVPAAWAGKNLADLKTAMQAHIAELLARLKKFGVEPEWVQLGNETRGGFMYPVGNLQDNPDNFAELVRAGHEAVKAIFPACSTIVHIDSGNNWSLYTRVFGLLKNKNVPYDMIAISIYPDADTWQTTIDAAITNIARAKTEYGKPVMVAEIGLPYDKAEEAAAMMSYLKNAIEKSAEGIFWWEPEAPEGYNGGYTKGCFVNGAHNGALNCFKE